MNDVEVERDDAVIKKWCSVDDCAKWGTGCRMALTVARQKKGGCFSVLNHTPPCYEDPKTYIRTSYELWLDIYEDDIRIEAAENGSDRELDFDFEEYLERRYSDYVCNFNQEVK